MAGPERMGSIAARGAGSTLPTRLHSLIALVGPPDIGHGQHLSVLSCLSDSSPVWTGGHLAIVRLCPSCPFQAMDRIPSRVQEPGNVVPDLNPLRIYQRFQGPTERLKLAVARLSADRRPADTLFSPRIDGQTGLSVAVADVVCDFQDGPCRAWQRLARTSRFVRHADARVVLFAVLIQLGEVLGRDSGTPGWRSPTRRFDFYGPRRGSGRPRRGRAALRSPDRR